MNRQNLLRELSHYAASWASGLATYPHFAAQEEQGIVRTITDYVAAHPRCFERDEHSGHITGSALVVSPDMTQVLLTLHRKLGLWLQLGGHCDGDPEVHRTALREAQEESGLPHLGFLRWEHALTDRAKPSLAGPARPFDLDFHAIPARKQDQAHIHYDIRYLIVGDPRAKLGMTDESNDLRWFTIDDARGVTSERSMHRQFDKLEWLQRQLRT